MSFDIRSFRHDVVVKAAAMTFKCQSRKSGFFILYMRKGGLNPSSIIRVISFCCFCLHVCAVYLRYLIKIRYHCCLIKTCTFYPMRIKCDDANSVDN